MATRETQGRTNGGGSLPGVVPFSLSHVTRMSWALGTRTVEADPSSLVGAWTHTDSGWALSVFEVTNATVVFRVRTPAGRERFYGAARMDFAAVRPSLATASAWRCVDDGDPESSFGQ